MAEIDVARDLRGLIAALEHPGQIHPALARQVSAEAERLLQAEISRQGQGLGQGQVRGSAS